MIIERKANDKINSILDVIWYVDESNLEESRRSDIIVPSGHIHIVYNFEDPYFIDEEENKEQISDVVLVGQFKNAIKIKYGRHVKQLGLAIHPSALYALFHQVSGIYTGAIIDCSQIKSMVSTHKAVLEIVNNYENIEEMLNQIELYFERYHYIKSDVKLFEDMIAYLDENKGSVDIRVMADYFAYSVSSLERNFKKHIGLTPKAYADILRFRYAILEEDPQIMFYDQSHFIKNCRKYTKKIPAGLSSAEEISLLHMLEISKE